MATFTIYDYIVFSAMLILSAICGVYFGYFKKHISKNKEDLNFGSSAMNEYLLGSKKLKVFPVARSLVASYVSGVTILGTPAEVYNFGTQYWLIIVSIVFMAFTVSLVYLPVFCSLNLGSSYEVRQTKRI